MIERLGERRGVHGKPPADCDHAGTTQRRRGEIRCARCWRVCRFYPQPIWHYAGRVIRLEDLQRLREGGTL